MAKGRYEIVTLDPERMLKYAEKTSKNGHKAITYSMDFYNEGAYDKRDVTLSTEERSENALMWQIICCLNGGKHEDKDSNYLKDHFFILDFSRLFKYNTELKVAFDQESFDKFVESGNIQEIDGFIKNHKKEIDKFFDNNKQKNDKFIDNYNIHGFEDILLNVSAGCRGFLNIALYFLFKYGFYIEYGEDNKRHFVPFEGSASMLRSARVSFVNEEIKAKVDERLMLGMDLKSEKIQVRPHKYFAYRALYMTDASRIKIGFDSDKEHNKGNSVDDNSDFIFNEETVIVIQDDSVSYKVGEVSQITANYNIDSDYWDITDNKEKIEINPYDGEGLICPSYAREINNQLYGKSKETAEATSFQIRLPFVKGMLHMVNFDKFFKEKCKIDYSQNYNIKDVFGIDRDLRKAKIILTKSMTKFFGCLNNYKQKHQDVDPMKLFFEKLKEYDHSLYISRTDLNLDKSRKKIKLNYQFLNTLCIDSKGFGKILKKHIEEIEELRKNEDSQRELILGDSKIENSAWKYVLSKNLNFVKEEYVKEQIRQAIDSRIKDIYKGNIRVEGENRFLSGDLLSLLIYIYELGKDNGSYNQRNFEELQKYVIEKNSFCMPSPRLKIESGKDYGILRNPHLSRNEDCILRCKNDEIYNEYFSHLTGIIMVAYKSLAPMTLGGADFDGDMVKMIADVDIIKAMRKGKKLSSKLVKIPSGGEGYVDAPKGLTYSHIKDVFGNQIGHISNMAIRLGEKYYPELDKKPESEENLEKSPIKEYESEEKKGGDNKHKYIPADCTLLTGLEIDAAKTGKHPKKNIEELEKQTSSEQKDESNYITVLTKLKEIDSHRKYICKKDTKDTSDEESYKIVYKEEDDKKSLTINKISNEVANIENLPAYYFETMFSEKSGNTKLDKFTITDYFTGFSNADDVLLEKARAIIYAYNHYTRCLRMVKNIESNIKKVEWYRKVMVIFRRQHFGQMDYSDKLNGLERIYSAIEAFILNKNDHDEYGKNIIDRAKEILNKIENENWIFTKKDERETVLYKIIPEDAFKLEKDNISIITDFSQKGYMLLYYIVKDIKNNNTNADDINKSFEKPKDENDDENIGKYGGYSDEYKEMYKNVLSELKENYTEALMNKIPFNKFEKKMMDRINEKFTEDNVDEYAEAFYKVSKSFFWKFYEGPERFEKFKKLIMLKESNPYKTNKSSDKWLPDIPSYDDDPSNEEVYE